LLFEAAVEEEIPANISTNLTSPERDILAVTGMKP